MISNKDLFEIVVLPHGSKNVKVAKITPPSEEGPNLTPRGRRQAAIAHDVAVATSHVKGAAKATELAKAGHKAVRAYKKELQVPHSVIAKHFGVEAATNVAFKPNYSRTSEVRPETPELTAGHTPARTSYRGDRPRVAKKEKLVKHKPPPMVCKTCHGRTELHTWHPDIIAVDKLTGKKGPKYLDFAARGTEPGHVVHAQRPIGKPRGITKTTRVTLPSKEGPKIPTRSTTASWERAPQTSKGYRDVRGRGTEEPTAAQKDILRAEKEKDLNASVKSFANLIEQLKRTDQVVLDVATLGSGPKFQGKKIKTIKDIEDELFGKTKVGENMNPDKIANEIIREAFTSGDRDNTTKGNGMADAGGTARLMLSGEWFGSPTWAYDQSCSPDFEKSAKLQLDQATVGQGQQAGSLNAMENTIGKDIASAMLEDTPSSIYSDPDSVGYLINALAEAGYAEFAEKCYAICEDADESHVAAVVEMVEKLEADKAEPFLIEQLTKFGALLLPESDTTMTPTMDAGGSDKGSEGEPSASDASPSSGEADGKPDPGANVGDSV